MADDQAEAMEAKMRAGADERRALARREYVRAHAPTILAGYLAQKPEGVSDGQIREQAIRIAGLLFDETEMASEPRPPVPLFNRATYAILNGEDDGCRCTFDKAWVGPCGEPVVDRGMCAKHAHEKCVSCGAQATLGCDFDGQFICGYPLCSECEHMPPPPGAHFGVGSGHAKKDVARKAWAERTKG